jgi:CRISPR-associated protein Cas1
MQWREMELRRDDAVLGSVPLIKIDDVVVFGNVGISTPALKRLLDRGIEVTFLTTHGRYHGRLVGQGPPVETSVDVYVF